MVSVAGEELTPKEIGANFGRIIVVVGLLSLLAHIQLPWLFYPSTLVSLQSVGVFIAAILMGPLWGTLSVLVLLGAGAAGLPVLHGGSGIEFLLSAPKGGYILAYLPATVLIGYLVHRSIAVRTPSEISVKELLIATVGGILLLMTAVTVWYMMVEDTGVGTAIAIAPTTYFWIELLKIVLVVGVIRVDLFVPN